MNFLRVAFSSKTNVIYKRRTHEKLNIRANIYIGKHAVMRLSLFVSLFWSNGKETIDRNALSSALAPVRTAEQLRNHKVHLYVYI